MKKLIVLELKIKFYNGLFSEPTHIETVGNGNIYRIEFDSIICQPDIKRSEAVFRLEMPHVKILENSKYYLSLDELCGNVGHEKGIMFFDKDYANIIWYKIKAWNERERWPRNEITSFLYDIKAQVAGKKETDITGKQWKFIFDIEKRFNVCFDGEDKTDAREFIGQYSDKMKKKQPYYSYEELDAMGPDEGYGKYGYDEMMWEAPNHMY